MAIPSVPSKELYPGASAAIIDLLKDKTITLIGLLKSKSDVGDDVFNNVVLTVKDGKVIYAMMRDNQYVEEHAINDATEWIDSVYYG
jgi:hypothetical protein